MLHGRSDNAIKNRWHSHLLALMCISGSRPDLKQRKRKSAKRRKAESECTGPPSGPCLPFPESKVDPPTSATPQMATPFPSIEAPTLIPWHIAAIPGSPGRYQRFVHGPILACAPLMTQPVSNGHMQPATRWPSFGYGSSLPMPHSATIPGSPAHYQHFVHGPILTCAPLMTPVPDSRMLWSHMQPATRWPSFVNGSSLPMPAHAADEAFQRRPLNSSLNKQGHVPSVECLPNKRRNGIGKSRDHCQADQMPAGCKPLECNLLQTHHNTSQHVHSIADNFVPGHIDSPDADCDAEEQVRPEASHSWNEFVPSHSIYQDDAWLFDTHANDLCELAKPAII